MAVHRPVPRHDRVPRSARDEGLLLYPRGVCECRSRDGEGVTLRVDGWGAAGRFPNRRRFAGATFPGRGRITALENPVLVYAMAVPVANDLLHSSVSVLYDHPVEWSRSLFEGRRCEQLCAL